jgi:hypothetical protein
MGVRITGSSNVITNGQPSSRALRDFSVHTCPHCAVNMTVCGSPDVIINGTGSHRIYDCETEFCGVGMTVTGSPNVTSND